MSLNPLTKTNPVSIDCLIFDLDGTLVDTKKDIANAANQTLSELGLETVPDEVVHSFVGKGISNLMAGCLGEGRSAEVGEAVTLFRKHYRNNLTTFSDLYPGVKETLNFFKHKKKAVLTNKIESFSNLILKDLKVTHFFEKVWGGDSGPEMKPHPYGIQSILTHLQVRAERAVLVGDSTVDIQTGKNSGVLTCAVTYGFDTLEKLKGAEPDFIIESFEQLQPLFL